MTENIAIAETELVDVSLRFGAHVAQRLRDERVIWLTTVSTNAMPQPRPVRFLWHNGSFHIFSTPEAHKINHIAQNPNVALHFDAGPFGEDVAVFLGKAKLKTRPFPHETVEAYLAKYAEDIVQRGFSTETYIKPNFVLVKVTPTKLRG